jgi:hypothetical protein
MNWFERQGYRQGYQEGWAYAEERIIELIEDNDWEFTIIGEDGVKYELGDTLITLIKEEDKTNPWTSRPLTEEDIEHYGSIKGEKY